MLAALPPAADDLATTDDVRVASSELRREMAEFRTEMRTEMAEFRTEMRTEMAEFRAEMRTEMANFRAEIKAEIAELRNDMVDRFAQQDRHLADVQRFLLIAMVTMLISAVSLAFAAARFA